MKDKWRIPFTIGFGGAPLIAAYVGIINYGVFSGIIVATFLYILIGVILALASLALIDLSDKEFARVIVAWLPMIWLEQVVDWCLD